MASGGDSSTGVGGGLCNAAGTGTLSNSILWGNSALADHEIHNTSTLPAIRYSDVEGSGGSGAGWDTGLGTDGGGNIDADPLFVDAAGGDLHLQLTSAAIDAGDNGAVSAGVTTDLDGHPRFADVPSVPDTGLGTPPIVDMGAYEAGPALALHKSLAPVQDVAYHGVVTDTLLLENAGTLSDTVLLTDTLPAGVAFGGWVVEPAGAIRDGKTIAWTGTLDAGESVVAVFTATHTGWYGDVIANTACYSGTAQAGSASAAFTVEQGYSLTVHVDGEGSGVVTLDPPGGVYDHGTVVALTATADAGSTFVGGAGRAAWPLARTGAAS